MNRLKKIFTLFNRKPASPKITTLINYCTNDYKFIGPCIKEAQKFSEEVIVLYTDYFYDGTPENQYLIDKTIKENPNVKFEFYEFDINLNRLAQLWHGYVRLIGWKVSSPETSHILFLDADEVVDAERFNSWLQKYPVASVNVIKLANYYYFRETCYQAETFEDSVVFARKDLLTDSMFLDYLDRDQIYREIAEPKARMVMGIDKQPLIHHYSWVRNEEEMIKKVSTWGHKHERPWLELVIEEFKNGFKGKDFVHHYTYKTVEPFIKITD